jgi:hypothetical protein
MSGGTDNQDACRIGAVTPEEYRTLAAEIAALAPIHWEAALDAKYQSEGVAATLRERLEQVLAGRTSVDEQIAAMPAQLRLIGAELSYAERTTVTPTPLPVTLGPRVAVRGIVPGKLQG